MQLYYTHNKLITLSHRKGRSVCPLRSALAPIETVQWYTISNKQQWYVIICTAGILCMVISISVFICTCLYKNLLCSKMDVGTCKHNHILSQKSWKIILHPGDWKMRETLAVNSCIPNGHSANIKIVHTEVAITASDSRLRPLLYWHFETTTGFRRSCRRPLSQIASSWGQYGAHLGPVGPRWAPCWPHGPCYQGS